MTLNLRARRARLLSLLAITSFTTTLPAHADEAPLQLADAAQLPGVTVTDQRPRTLTVPSLEAARAAADEVAGGAAVVDAESYKTGRASTITDALGYAPGVFVQPRFGAEESRLSIRGSGVQRTFHGRGITLLQDGAPLNLADGGFDFQAVEPLSAQYIEVYRGANALEYGSTTLGGAINFVSPTGLSAPALTARLEAGSFEYRRAQLAVAGQTGNADGYLSLSGVHTDGFRAHSQQDNYRLFSNAGVRIRPDLESRLYFSFVDTESELPGSLTRAELNSKPESANPANISGNQKRDFRLIRIADRTSWTIDSTQRLDASVYYAEKRLFHPIFQIINQLNNDVGTDVRYENTATLFGHRNRFVIGQRFVYGQTRETDFVNVAGGPGAQTDASDQTARSIAGYFENQFFVLPKLAVALGGQLATELRDKLDTFVPAGQANTSFKKDYGAFSPKFGLRYDVTAGTQVFANLSRSFEPPSFAELTGGQITTVNSAQHGTTIELGTRVETANLALDAALYRATLRNELLGLNDPNGQPLGTINAPKTVHQGLELAGQAKLPYGFSWRAAYLLNDFRFDGNASYGDNRLAGLPLHELRSELSWTHGGFYAGPNIEWVPVGGWVDHANMLSADGYTLLGFKLGGAINDGHWRWFIDARNLTDETYAATTGVIANAAGRDQRQFLPGDGRSVYLGLEWRVGS